MAAINGKKIVALVRYVNPNGVSDANATFTKWEHLHEFMERGAKLYVHELDAPALADPELNVSGVIGAKLTLPQADVLLCEGDVVREAGLELTEQQVDSIYMYAIRGPKALEAFRYQQEHRDADSSGNAEPGEAQ